MRILEMSGLIGFMIEKFYVPQRSKFMQLFPSLLKMSWQKQSCQALREQLSFYVEQF